MIKQKIIKEKKYSNHNVYKKAFFDTKFMLYLHIKVKILYNLNTNLKPKMHLNVIYALKKIYFII